MTRDFDNQLIIIVSLLTAMGTIIMFSASSPYAENFGSPMFFLNRHMIALMIGAGLLVVLSRIDYRYIKRMAGVMLILSMVLVFAGYILNNTKDASRWLLYSDTRKMITTSDFLKYGIIIFSAYYLEKYQRQLDDLPRVILPFFGILGFAIMLVLRQPDLSTSLGISAIAGSLLFIGGIKFRYLIPAVLFVGMASIWSLLNNSYQLTRLWSWRHPGSNLTSTNWQSYNAKIALGNGGWFGTGLGDGVMKRGYVPEAHTDFIYSVIGEELGIFVSIFILGLFLWLFLRSVKIAQTASDAFGMYLALGIGLNIALYCAINVAYVSGIFPTTGLPLPFISYGGTSTILVLASMGILLNISYTARNRGIGRFGRRYDR